MKRLLIGITGLIGLITSSCTLSLLATAIPKDLILQGAICPNESSTKTENFRVISTQRWSQGIVVLYSALCPTDGKTTSSRWIFGHKLVKRSGISWEVSGSQSYSPKPLTSKPKRLIDYRISKSMQQGKNPYAVLYGQTLNPKVAIIEATFDNGQILRDRSNNGAFALVASGATGVCEVRILGSDNQILQQEDLIMPKQFKQNGQIQKCLPVTHQL